MCLHASDRQTKTMVLISYGWKQRACGLVSVFQMRSHCCEGYRNEAPSSASVCKGKLFATGLLAIFPLMLPRSTRMRLRVWVCLAAFKKSKELEAFCLFFYILPIKCDYKSLQNHLLGKCIQFTEITQTWIQCEIISTKDNTLTQ